MKTAIILVNFQRLDLVKACLHGLAEAAPSHPLYLIDNASGEQEQQALTTLAEGHHLFLNRRNLGFGRANNIGIRAALDDGAEYVWLLNTDTVVNAATLPAMEEVMRATPEAGAVGSVLYSHTDPHRLQTIGGGFVDLKRMYTRPCLEMDQADRLDFITGASLLLRREALEDAGWFDEDFFMYWEDVDLCLRLRDKGWKLAVAPDSTLLHMEGASSERTPGLRDAYAFRSALRMIRKHSPCPVRSFLVGIAYDRILKDLVRLRFRKLGTVLTHGWARAAP